jgi:hypothetical protein
MTKTQMSQAMGAQETLNTEHWIRYPSMMTLTEIKTEGMENKR